MVNQASWRNSALEQVDFDQFKVFLQEACGISLGENKQYLVTSRLRVLLEEHDMTSFTELLKALSKVSNRSLRNQVIDVMTTNETFWFRDNYPYEYFSEKILPNLFSPSESRAGPIRIWSAACSSGQEPYSLSMIIEERKHQILSGLSSPVQILATDLSSSILERARSGVYDQLSVMRGLSTERRKLFFDSISDKEWRIKNQVRDRVEFKSLNLLDSYVALGRFDVVFCRNVLIYFDGELKNKILKKIHSCLNPGGVLFLGSSESLGASADLYEMVHCEPGIMYRAL